MSGVKQRQIGVFVVPVALAVLVACNSGPGPQSDWIHTIEQIKLNATAEHLTKVRFEGIVTIVNPSFGFLMVQDHTGAIRVQPSRFVESSMIAHRVLVVGNTSETIGADTISDASLTDLGIAKLPAALPISANELRSDRFDGKLVTVVGTARVGQVDSSAQLVVPVRIGGLEATVRFMDDSDLAGGEFDDAEIRITGVASTGADIQGNLTDLAILVPGGAAIQITRSAPDPATLKVQTVARILTLRGPQPAHRIRLQGQLENAGDSAGLQLTDGSGSIAVVNAAGVNTTGSRQVDVVAFVAREGAALSLRDVRLTSVEIPSSARIAAAKGTVITSVAQLHALSADGAGLEKPVSLKAVVTYYDPTWGTMFVQDSTGGAYVTVHGSVQPPPMQVGDVVLLHGVSGAGDFAPIVQKPSFQVVGHGSLPTPSKLSAETIFSGLADSQWVELEGIVHSVGVEAGHPIAKLAWGSHQYRALLPPAAHLPLDWIDRRFRVRGACGTLFNGKRQVLGIQLFVQRSDQFTPLPDSALGENSRATPAITPIDKLLQFTPNEIPDHRVHLHGKVAAAHLTGPTSIRDDSGAVVIRDHNEIALQSGDIVDVEGFAVPGAFAPEISDAVIAKKASGAPVRPIDVTPAQALFGGMDGQLVRIEGRLVSEYLRGQEQMLLLQTGKAAFAVRSSANLPSLDSGAVLRVIGICTVTAKRFRAVMVPISFEIAVDSPASVILIHKAPWFTQRRTLRFLALTLCLVTAALIWAFMLRRRVGAQTRFIEQKLLEVETLKEKAEAASAAKSQFLANMSHEIRTPMNGILGMTELAMQAESPDEQRECLATIRSSGDALLSILNDLLDLSKIEAGKFTLELGPFSIRQLIQDIGKVFAFSIRQKGLAFDSSVAGDLPDLLLGDSFRLRQVLLNLLGNAVKFTHEGFVAMEASGERRGDQVHLHLVVRDSGIGIPLEKLGDIFEAFHQADDSTARKYGGTGLGLSICVKLVTLMGGEISVNSIAGQGSTFSVDVVVQETVRVEDVLESAVNGTARGSLPLNILVVEDNLVNQRLAEKLLTKQGHKATVAGNGRLAVEHFRRETFDLILMDVQMPEMDGLDATIEIRRLEQAFNTHIPIIAMTAQTMKGDRDRCFAAGMDAFVSKPIHLPELFAAIEAIASVRLTAFNPETFSTNFT